ncbi:MAG TPA: hypothetical protein VHM65_00895 [Candidatus Lustribacter sp.]|nr:hypothetical protein [Candidatus Lustribacter sp.]
MTYTLFGSLTAVLCQGWIEPLTGLEIQAHVQRADAVDTPAQGQLVGTAAIHARGAYRLVLASTYYSGGLVDLSLVMAAPPREPFERGTPPLHVGLGTITPLWRMETGRAVADWDCELAQQQWRSMLRRFGVWTICGRLVSATGATVTAYDADWIQDDLLGESATDAEGRFLITYVAADFRRTPLSPVITMGSGGPDVYFTAQHGGRSILHESRAEGRRAERRDIDDCYCVELEADV